MLGFRFSQSLAAARVLSIARVFGLRARSTQAFGTIDWVLNATTARGGAQSMFRAIMPEGQLTLDNTTFDIGGLSQTSTFSENFVAFKASVLFQCVLLLRLF